MVTIASAPPDNKSIYGFRAAVASRRSGGSTPCKGWFPDGKVEEGRANISPIPRTQ